MDFVARAAANPIGREVKLADVADNCGLGRTSSPTQRDHDRIAKYRTPEAVLKGVDHESAS
jgi:hypothetical protein